MDFEHLQYIVEVADRGSISLAAEHLYISQSYLSRIIKRVEQQFNTVLFVRTPQGISPTDAGEQFIQKAKLILAQYENLHRIQKDQSDVLHSFTLTSVRSSLVMETFLTLIDRYHEQSPYKFIFNESDGQRPIHDVTYYDADLGVIYTWGGVKDQLIKKLAQKDIVYEKICGIDVCVILGINHPLLSTNEPLTIEKLAPYGYVMYADHALPYVQDYFPKGQISSTSKLAKVQKRVYVNSRASLHNILYHTTMFSLGNQSAKDQEKMFNIASLPLQDHIYPDDLEIGVIYRKNIALHPIAKEMIDQLKENYSE